MFYHICHSGMVFPLSEFFYALPDSKTWRMLCHISHTGMLLPWSVFFFLVIDGSCVFEMRLLTAIWCLHQTGLIRLWLFLGSKVFYF